ncbi:MAG: heme-binding protein [Candidatus Dadabacteria bacterium]|nr:heme-binding domain-containing protein [Candidatus Dadabacteria bacterium]NIV40875.1 heme-binding protein [Candidatus Dadabacteria bacterium]NIX16214.1 heme-binding protein [Candidatus Dadabacteria bacterium]NIY22837.1 heme-binding protein [Candidatus Dadabacteria bacterium]
MKKYCKYFLVIIIVLLFLIQLVPVARTNPPVTSDIETSSDLKKIFKRACYDCHSNETKWPWYSKVAPPSWFVINHINEGRDEYNFSTWDKYSLEKKSEIIEEIWEEVDEGKMPLWSYIILHPEAKLSAQDKKVIYDWAKIHINDDENNEHGDDD